MLRNTLAEINARLERRLARKDQECASSTSSAKVPNGYPIVEGGVACTFNIGRRTF